MDSSLEKKKRCNITLSPPKMQGIEIPRVEETKRK